MLTDEELIDLWMSAPNESTFGALVGRYARAVERAAYEAAIKVCESLENRVIGTHPARIEFDPNSLMARKCAGAIRSLMQEQPK